MTVEDMLDRMSTLLWYDGHWHARARGESWLWGKSPVLRTALEAALGLDDLSEYA